MFMLVFKLHTGVTVGTVLVNMVQWQAENVTVNVKGTKAQCVEALGEIESTMWVS